MQPREFLRAVPGAVRAGLPPPLATFHTGTGYSLAKLWYGNRDIHYEVEVRARRRALDIGLHFEADPLTNARLLAAFRARTRAIRRALGDEVRVEEWDRGWARVWEPSALDTLDDAALTRVAARVAAYVIALEPIVVAELPADVRWTEPRARQRARAGVRAKHRR